MLDAVKRVLKKRNKAMGLNLWAKQWKDRIYINGGDDGPFQFYIDSFGEPHFKWYEPGTGPRLLANLIKLEIQKSES
jgi:hypothetical protein